MQPALTHMPWPCGQAEPLETHWFETWSQQPSPMHALFAQHVWPGPPHWAHRSPAEHARSPLLQVRFAQHGWPTPPHGEHRPPAQPSDALLQERPAQHG
jgi:hypothetical protein